MKTAVILTGAPRTWHFCKDYIVKFVNDVFIKDIDWFICLHESSTSSKEEIQEFFLEKKQNVVYLKCLKKEELFNYDSSWNFKKWTNVYYKELFQLNYIAGLEKRLYEFKTGNIYDVTFIARPDCIYLYNDNTKRIHFKHDSLKDFCFHLGGDFSEASFKFSNPSADHLHILSGKFSTDLYLNWNLDYNYKKSLLKPISFRLGTDMHSGLSNYVQNHLLSVEQVKVNKPYLKAEVVRPTHIVYKNKKLEFLINNFNQINFNDLNDHEPGYCEYFKNNNIEKRMEYILYSCFELSIDPKDYGFYDKEYVERKRNEYIVNNNR